MTKFETFGIVGPLNLTTQKKDLSHSISHSNKPVDYYNVKKL